MCALCGILGEAEHWTDAGRRAGVFTRNSDAAARRRERAGRVAAANRVLAHYGMTLADWEGTSYLLSRRTGATVMVANLSHLWAAAEGLAGRPCDPLADDLIARLEAADG